MNTRPTILLVDDDPEITELLSTYLARFGFAVHSASDAASMRAQLTHHMINLVVLDVMLPGTDGLALAREIRAQSRLPVIMLTARVATLDRILGLESGADDYMSKPFEPRELVARIQCVLRRVQGSAASAPSVAASDVVCFDGWELHRDERTVVSPSGLVAALSNAEFRLLNTFLQTPRRLLSRDQLMEQARGRAMDAFERSIDLLVSRLRHKLADEASEVPMIKTVRGAGYVFNVQSVQARPAWRV
jgi:two-component system OmpR family response regulator